MEWTPVRKKTKSQFYTKDRPGYLPLSKRRQRHKAIVAYVINAPDTSATKIASVFNVSEGLVRLALRRAGYRLEWVKNGKYSGRNTGKPGHKV